MRFLITATIIALASLAPTPAMARADGPGQVITITGQVADQDVTTGQPTTRAVTLSLVLPSSTTPTVTQLDDGQAILFDPTVTLGDVISGAGAFVVATLLLFVITARVARGVL